MSLYAPDYYKSFHCIASACRHSCCVGWQIPVDDASLYRYRVTGGEMGERLNAAIVEKEGCAAFCLSKEGRCPFLNREGLCDIILTLGEEYLTEICTEHPRFYHTLGKRTELGLGLACEEAARLILTQTAPLSLVCIEGEEAPPDRRTRRLLSERERILSVAQDGGRPLRERLYALLSEGRLKKRLLENALWIPFYRSLERLESAFDAALATWETASEAFPTDLEKAGERLLVYFIYRHASGVRTPKKMRARAALAALMTRHVLSIAAAHGGTLDGLLDAARLYSAEIEYSEENTAALARALHTL